MFSVAEQLPTLDLDTTYTAPSMKIVKKILPAPKVGDDVLIPDNNNPDAKLSNIAKRLVGGYATVQRVVSSCDENGNIIHFINVTEHSGYVEYKWEGFLAEMQEDLSNKFDRVNRAHLKSI